MAKRIRPIEPTLKKLRDTGAALPRIEADEIAKSLGAEVSAERTRGLELPRKAECPLALHPSLYASAAAFNRANTLHLLPHPYADGRPAIDRR
jgi:hypothetical protein